MFQLFGVRPFGLAGKLISRRMRMRLASGSDGEFSRQFADRKTVRLFFLPWKHLPFFSARNMISRRFRQCNSFSTACCINHVIAVNVEHRAILPTAGSLKRSCYSQLMERCSLCGNASEQRGSCSQPSHVTALWWLTWLFLPLCCNSAKGRVRPQEETETIFISCEFISSGWWGPQPLMWIKLWSNLYLSMENHKVQAAPVCVCVCAGQAAVACNKVRSWANFKLQLPS